MTHIWMSFASATANAGVIISDAPTFNQAIARSVASGANPAPHASVQAQAIEGLVVPGKYLNRLLKGRELDQFQDLPQAAGVRSVPMP